MITFSFKKLNMSIRLTQKLYFYTLETKYDSTIPGNTQVETVLFQEWADVRSFKAQEDQDDTQITQLGITHTVVCAWLPQISQQMTCYRLIRAPGGAVTKQHFRVMDYQPVGQGNKQMIVYLSADTETAQSR